VADFQRTFLPAVDVDKLLRAARVGKDIKTYDDVARSQSPEAGYSLPVKLTDGEKWALKRERDVPISEKGMYIVVLTVSLAAFLQGQVQSSSTQFQTRHNYFPCKLMGLLTSRIFS